MLPQEIDSVLAGCQRILLAGAGGGYDVFGAVPLASRLVEMGKSVHFASLSFTYLNGLSGAVQHAEIPNLYEVPAHAALESTYCPEAWLAHWLESHPVMRGPVWGFDKTGVVPLRQAYRYLVDHLELDAVVLVDGGVDAILRGDESSLGTPAEDLASVAAVRELDVPTKVLACVGMGAEIRDGICHEQVLARVAELIRLNGFLGSCALTPASPHGQAYLAAVQHAFAHQLSTRRSHVHKVVMEAMAGRFGADGSHVWLSPLLSTFWFFSLDVVADSHLFLAHLTSTTTIWEVQAHIEACRHSLAVRDRTRIPI